jgi:hypothetical protein
MVSPTRDARWWLDTNEDDRADIIQDVAGQLWRALEPTRTEMFRWGNLYENMPMSWLSGRMYRRQQVASTVPMLSLNVAKSVVDTYVALLTKDQPKISFVTDGGDWDLQEKAKLLEKFTAGVMTAADLYDLAQQVAFDSAKFPFGAVKIYAQEGEDDEPPKIAIDRVLPWELLIGDFDSVYGNPKEFYHLRWVDRLALQEEYPDFAADLEAVSGKQFFDGQSGGYQDVTSQDVVVVVEAYHLPRTEGGKGGRATITCGDVILSDAPYLHSFSPFLLMHRQTPTTGIYGISLLKELAPIQLGINCLLRDIQRAQQLIVGHWLVGNGSTINTGAINDKIGGVIRYTGQTPVYYAPPQVAQEVYAHLDRLYSRAFEIVGISQMSAQAQKPPGLNSGKAMLVYADVQSQRFEPCYKLYQKFFLSAARQILALARDISKDHPGYEVKAIGKASMSVIKASDALLADHEFDLKLYPTNAFADDPAARLEQVQDMLAAQLIDPATAKRLMDMPDLDSEADMENASYNLVMSIVDRMLKDGKYIPPEPFMQLSDPADGGPGAITLVQRLYLKAKLGEVPEKRLELLRRWMTQAQGILSPPPPLQLASPSGGPASPSAGPATPLTPPTAGGPLGPAQTPQGPPPMVQAA